ncbi:MAG TPA: DUF4388 domain-containing protein [Anaeromyxobacteraceae bacterium]|nr:DUF4388 domain-containing protein [Anaeromyxobacteraceae bacterium]
MANWLDIDPHGRVTPAGDEARRALADRAGRFALLPSAPDLLLAHRAPSAGGAAPRPRVLLAGDLSGFPIADFIAFVHQSRLSGLLTVASGGVERSVAFKDGEVRGARSTAPGERIGEVALALGYVDARLLDEAAAGGRPIGKALVDLGHLSASDLWKCLHEQVTAVFHAILLAPEGLFFLVDDDSCDRPGAPLSVSTQSLLMDGIRRIDEARLFRARIPGPGAFLRRREPKRPVALRPPEQQLLALVDGRRTVAEVAAAAHLGEFDATKLLYHLAEAGYVEAAADPVPAPAADPALRIEELIEGYDGLLRLVAAALPDAGRPAFLAAVAAHLGEPGAPFAPLFRGLVPGPDGGLDRRGLLANLGRLGGPTLPPGEAPRLLQDALRELLFFHLFLAGERIPREADEALGQRVRRGLARLEGLGGA